MTDHPPLQPSQPWPAASGSDLGGYRPTPQQPRPPTRRWGVVDLLMALGLAFVTVVWVILRATSGPPAATVPGDGVGLAPGIAPTSAPIPGASKAGDAAPSTGGLTPSAGGHTTPLGRRLDVAAVAAVVNPSVVDIVTTLDAGRGSAAGTGIVLNSSGEVLTNNHVIEGGISIAVTDVGTGRTYAASVAGYDRSRDLAVIQLRGASGVATAPIGDSSKVAIGDAIVAIGNAGGRGGSPTAVGGTVSGLDLTIMATDADGSNAERLTGLIQIAANVEPGDSGGPLVNSSARVVGVVAAGTASHSAVGGGTGFAIPIGMAVGVARQIETGQGSDTVHIGATAFPGVTVATASGGLRVIIVGWPPARRPIWLDWAPAIASHRSTRSRLIPCRLCQPC